MKFAPILIALLFVTGMAFADNTFTPSSVWDGVKISHPNQGPGFTFAGGENIATATVIPSLPYSDFGSNLGAIDDYEEVCPYSSTSGDVVYSYTPAADIIVTIDLCQSYYDTKVFVYEDVATPGFPYACNDDFCSGPNYPFSYLSYIEQVYMYAGHTYYIVVDGYGGSEGDYILDVYPYEECDVICDVAAIPEGEPLCGPTYIDNYNGGCNSTPYIFQTVMCPSDPVIYCGESGNYDNGYTYSRDTDWFEIILTETKTITATVEAEFNVLMFLLDGNPTPGPDPCLDADVIITSITSTPCNPVSLSWTFAPGTYWVWVGPSGFYDGIPCGAEYELTIEGYCPTTATESSSWGEVKQLFR